MEVKHW